MKETDSLKSFENRAEGPVLCKIHFSVASVLGGRLNRAFFQEAVNGGFDTLFSGDLESFLDN